MANNNFKLRVENGIELVSSTGDVNYLYGDGSPDGTLTAPKGSLYLDITNAIIYQNQDGSTSWLSTAPSTFDLQDVIDNDGSVVLDGQTVSFTKGAGTADIDVGIGVDFEYSRTDYSTSSLDTVANKRYVDSIAQGLTTKDSVKVATTTALTGTGLNYSSNSIEWDPSQGPSTIDGVTLSDGDRILVKSETDGAGILNAEHNGIYIRVGQDQWDRTLDADTWDELISAYVWVEEGTVNGDSGWTCTIDSGGTLGTSDVTWVLFASAGQLIAGIGLTKNGNDIDFDPDTLTEAVVDVSLDYFSFTDNDDSLPKKESIADFIAFISGVGIGYLDGVQFLDLNELTDTLLDVSADSIVFIDADDSNNSKKETVDDFVGSISGNGLLNTSGVQSVRPDTTSTTTTEANAISVNSNGVSVKVDDSTIEGSNQGVAGTESLRVKDKIKTSGTGVDATSGFVVDSVDTSIYTTAEWLVTVYESGSTTDIYSSKVLGISNGSSVDYTEFGVTELNMVFTGVTITVIHNAGGSMDLTISAGASLDRIDYTITRVAQK